MFSRNKYRNKSDLVQTHHKDGEDLYNRAATLVRDNKDFYNQVHQKKYLELGKHYMQVNDARSAINCFKKVIGLKTREIIYKNQSLRLMEQLKNK